jgi:heme/copper-type cytochrome/quinol oxidase subunit 3
MSEGSDNAPSLMASLFGAKALIEYGANFVSDFDFVDSCIGEGSFYYCFRIHGLHLIKNLTGLRVSLVRKTVHASENKLLT